MQDRETEPRFTGPPSRGDFGGGMRGGFQGGGYGGGPMGGGGGGGPPGGARQLYISNVCPSSQSLIREAAGIDKSTASFQCWLARP